MIINLPAMLTEGDYVQTDDNIYDLISGNHRLTVVYTKMSHNIWSAQVSVDNIKLNKGTLIFKNDGKLSKQEGFSHIQWPADYGLNDLKIDYSASTAYRSPFEISSITSNGYPLSHLVFLSISRDGDIELFYTNGQARMLKNRIAVAKFSNPTYLELVTDHLYRPTEKSGLQRLHRLNSEYAIISGYLEQEPCIKSLNFGQG